jgi:segregation and condensation protein B
MKKTKIIKTKTNNNNQEQQNNINKISVDANSTIDIIADENLDSNVDNAKYEELSLMLEAVLLSSDRAMTIDELLAIVNNFEQLARKDILTAISLLQQHNTNRSLDLIKTANGYQFVTKKQYSHLIAQLWQEKPSKYSRALLETLALIVYRQPITRGEIEQIRGVSISQNIFKTLQEDRGWIKVVGHKDVPGKPSLYATTKDFLTYFGLESLDQLPALPQIMEFLNNEDKSEALNK